MIRVFLADDHPLVREGLHRIIQDDPGLEVVGEAPDGLSLLKALESVAVDVLLLDISMPGPGFLELMNRLRTSHPDVKILVVSMYPETHYAERALQAGARGYLSKRQSVEELSQALRRVFVGGGYVSGQPAPVPTDRSLDRPDGSRIRELSAREFQVLILLAEGKGITEIAGELCLSPKTVSTYRLRVLQKLGMETNADLVRVAIDQQLII